MVGAIQSVKYDAIFLSVVLIRSAFMSIIFEFYGQRIYKIH